MKKIWIIEERVKGIDFYSHDWDAPTCLEEPSLLALFETEELAKEYVEWYVKGYCDEGYLLEVYEDYPNSWVLKDEDGEESSLFSIVAKKVFQSKEDFMA